MSQTAGRLVRWSRPLRCALFRGCARGALLVLYAGAATACAKTGEAADSVWSSSPSASIRKAVSTSVTDGGASDEPASQAAAAPAPTAPPELGGPAPMFVIPDASAPDVRVPASCTSAGQCARSCDGGAHTTISGTVFDPAGSDPLYGVAVYVPYRTPDAIVPGASCGACSDLYSGGAVAGAVTDAAGRFTIEDAPDGADVPLVVQIGKWRRQLVLPSVAPCSDNPQPDGSIRLPRNEGEGDLPSIAVSTGGADSLECLLRRVGVDASEYTAGASGPGRIHVFQGAGGSSTAPTPAPSSPASLWDSVDDLRPYDLVLLSCEGDETTDPNPDALHRYADLGGRVFASHFHYRWFTAPGSPFIADQVAAWSPGANQMPDPTNGVIETTLPDGGPFARGQAMNDWLGGVGALSDAGELPIVAARHNADVTTANPVSTPWIVASDGATPPGATEYFSWDTPAGAPPDALCGRVVYSDLHVGAASGDAVGAITPAGCADNPLSPQEKALEFMLFDLSSCLTPVLVERPVPEAGVSVAQ